MCGRMFAHRPISGENTTWLEWYKAITNAQRAYAYQVTNIASEILKYDLHEGKVPVAEN